jgi:hypothetical protein
LPGGIGEAAVGNRLVALARVLDEVAPELRQVLDVLLLQIAQGRRIEAQARQRTAARSCSQL